MLGKRYTSISRVSRLDSQCRPPRTRTSYLDSWFLRLGSDLFPHLLVSHDKGSGTLKNFKQDDVEIKPTPFTGEMNHVKEGTPNLYRWDRIVT